MVPLPSFLSVLILRELERAVFVSIESKGVAEWPAVPVDYEGDSDNREEAKRTVAAKYI